LRNVDRRRSLGNTAAALPEMAVPFGHGSATVDSRVSRSGYVVIAHRVSESLATQSLRRSRRSLGAAILARRL